MQIFGCLTFVLLLGIANAKKKHDSDEDDPEETTSNPTMDRLAVNLAGAFVKSLFPEMDRTNAPATTPAPTAPPAMMGVNQNSMMFPNAADVRRAPQHSALLQEASGPAFDSLSAFNNRYGGAGAASSVLSAVNNNNYGLQLPQGAGFNPSAAGLSSSNNVPLPTSQLADLIPSIADNMNIAGGGIEAINAAKRQKYLSELQHHQTMLNDYSAKQMEYLDQQRRYQQAMVDHQAGAALLMQQQQQEFLSKMKQKYAGFDDVGRKTDSEGLPDLQTGGKIFRRAKDPAKQHAVRTAAHNAFEEKTTDEGREQFASDEYLKQFFKKNYGIELPNEGEMSKLTEDERETLKQLKEHLIKEAKENGIKLGAIKTMEKFAEKRKTETATNLGDDLEKELAELEENTCAKCLTFTAKKLKGAWTQMYGNPLVMKDTYSTILSLMELNQMNTSRETVNVTSRHASCVGMEIGSVRHGEAALNFFFRDDGERKALHELNGKLVLLSNKEAKLDLEYLDTKMCIVKAGPADEKRFEYVVFAETSGTNKCKSHFVFARNSEDFNLRHFDDVSDYLKTQVINEESLPVAALPRPEHCQIS
uniref:Uncharacterized protein n=1 Tax=Panagrolaimus sp. JU765 TaxID=591449 RepID=A0AC34QH68_9BILA